MNIDLSRHEAEAPDRVLVSGEATIYQAGELVEALRGVLVEGSKVEVDLTEVTDVDSALIQVLVAAGREAERVSGTLVVRHGAASRALAATLGFALPEVP